MEKVRDNFQYMYQVYQYLYQVEVQVQVCNFKYRQMLHTHFVWVYIMPSLFKKKNVVDRQLQRLINLIIPSLSSLKKTNSIYKSFIVVKVHQHLMALFLFICYGTILNFVILYGVSIGCPIIQIRLCVCVCSTRSVFEVVCLSCILTITSIVSCGLSPTSILGQIKENV